MAFVAFPFWLWAVFKVTSLGDPDLGAGTFLVLLCASAWGVTKGPDYPEKQRFATAFGCGLVALNYGYALMIVSGPGTFQLYLAVGAIFWSGAGWTGWVICTELKEAETRVAYSSLETGE